MKGLAQSMWHWTVANAQVGITYFWLTGYMGVVLLVGFGKVPKEVLEDLTPITVFVMGFWFQRQRSSGDDKPTVASTNGNGSAPIIPPAPPAPNGVSL